ncbi:histidine kinase [Asanoa iriomotensis]|uniref:histidine kinase n=1 Tax=Asanoa iriomotensis TaxID=234613 RepID=A0ABQ4BX11_9ACTN|nr:two-component sensor histidine kinase [Asanoa iriomotensis]
MPRGAAPWTRSDVAVAAVVYVVTVVTTVAGEGRWDASTATIAAVACGVLALRRAYPFPTLVVTAVAAEAHLILMHGGASVVVLAAPLIALYTVAESTSSGRAWPIGVLGVAAFLSVHELVLPTAWLGAENLALAAFGGLALAAGHAARSRRAYLAEVEARAAHAEADRDAEAARRVTEERLRIARDLHDDIGHYLALIHVQAKVADHLLDAEPGRAREAITHVREASRTALSELGDTVAVLRRPDEPSAAPIPYAVFDDLFVQFRRSGLRITDRLEGSADAVPVAAGRTAYRVLRESLTNVCRHAGPTSVDVVLTFAPDELRIVVENRPGAAPPASQATGHGLIGMRERVTAVGGRFTAGPLGDGGFRVSAALPIGAA